MVVEVFCLGFPGLRSWGREACASGASRVRSANGGAKVYTVLLAGFRDPGVPLILQEVFLQNGLGHLGWSSSASLYPYFLKCAVGINGEK